MNNFIILIAIVFIAASCAHKPLSPKESVAKFDFYPNQKLCHEEIDDYWSNHFYELDTNRDMFLVDKETRKSVVKYNDSNRDGKVSIIEHMAQIDEFLSEHDLDSDGCLTENELTKI